MDKTNFISISGLDNFSLARFGFKLPSSGGKKAGNRVSAKDLGTLTAELLTRFPEVLDTAKIRKLKMDGKKVGNTNQMLKGGAFYDKALRVDGLKTGYTGSAGYCFVGTAKKAGRHRIAVVIVHARSSYDRFYGTRELMRTIYDRFALAG
jgi:D-alanyl-D-alanine carboxypeptidase (penicillin-binding protein 5/6)